MKSVYTAVGTGSLNKAVTPSPRGESLAQPLRKLELLPTVWRLSFGRSPFPRSPLSLRWLTWRWSRTSRPLPAKHVTNPDEVQKALRGLKEGKIVGPNGIQDRALTRLRVCSVLLLVQIFSAFLLIEYFPPVWKNARVISILKPAKDPAPPPSYRRISLLDTIDNGFEKILLTRILHQAGGCGSLRDEEFVSRLRHSTSLQLARLVERITRNFGEKRLTGSVFLYFAKAFDTVCIEGLL